MEDIKLYKVNESDAKELLGIYAPYVTDTAVSFEYTVPSVEEFSERIKNTLKKYPYIKAVIDGETVGYCYASAFKPREAYKFSVETSIYVKKGFTEKGIGKRLYSALESLLKAQNIINVNACIVYPKENDEYLTRNSAEFHERMGYSFVGKFTECGNKFGRWYDMIWMEKMIGEHIAEPKPFVLFSELTEKDFEAANVLL